MAVLRKDLQSIKIHAQALNGGELYPLLACIITARSWDSIRTGVDRTAVNRAEVRTMEGHTTPHSLVSGVRLTRTSLHTDLLLYEESNLVV